MIFTWSAPWRICSRAALRTSSTPSAIADLNCRPLQQAQSLLLPKRLVRRRESEWPPVGPIDWPAMIKPRADVICPVSIAVLMPQSAAAGVAHGGEAAVEHGAQPRRRARGDQRQRQRLHEADIDLAVDGVDVAVDQPRHQRAPAAVDDIGLGRLDRPVAEFLDACRPRRATR